MSAITPFATLGSIAPGRSTRYRFAAKATDGHAAPNPANAALTLSLSRTFARVAAAVAVCSMGSMVAPVYAQTVDQKVQSDSAIELEEIVVTGTSIRGQTGPVGAPMVSVSRDDIAAIAPQTTRDILATVPQFTQFNVAPSPNVFFTEAPNLRGLGSGTTLTLLNGHRILGPGLIQTAFDPSTIPTAAIDRIQIVADGTSAIYGSDAVAGVINLYTRHAFDGAEANAAVGMADGYTTHTYSLTGGHTWSTGSVLVAIQHSDSGSLRGSERTYMTADQQANGGADQRTTNTDAPNIVIDGVSYAYPDMLPNTVNKHDQVKDQDYVPSTKRTTVLASLRQELSDRVNLFTDVVYSKSRAEVGFAISNFNSFSFFMTPFNPFYIAPPGTSSFGEVVQYSFGNVFGYTQPVIDDGDAIDITLGADIDLGRDWKAEAMGTYGSSRMKQSLFLIDFATAYAAAAGTTTSTAFDPFNGLTDPAILAKIGDTRFIAYTDQTLKDATLKADGPLFNWFGGTTRAAIGVSAREEGVTANQDLGPNSTHVLQSAEVTRKVNAAFGELLVPFVAGDGMPGLRKLDLSIAERVEHYDSFGSVSNPKFGLSWTPVSGLLLRSSYGTSFRAPALTDIANVGNGVQVLPNELAPGTLTPPGSGPLNVLNIIGGNPHLKPEKAKTTTVGFDLTPAALAGFKASATWFDIKYDNVISTPQDHFTDPALSFTYILNPTEAQIDQLTAGLPFTGARFAPGQTGIIVDSRSQNLSVEKLQGIDYAVSQLWSTAIGDLYASVSGTYMIKFNTQATVNSAAVSQFIYAQQVRNRIRGALNWKKGRFGVGAAVNYTGSYRLQVPATNISSFTTADLNASWDLPLTGVFADTNVVVNVNNILDKDPPRYPTSPGFDSVNANPLGRLISLSVQKKF